MVQGQEVDVYCCGESLLGSNFSLSDDTPLSSVWCTTLCSLTSSRLCCLTLHSHSLSNACNFISLCIQYNEAWPLLLHSNLFKSLNTFHITHGTLHPTSYPLSSIMQRPVNHCLILPFYHSPLLSSPLYSHYLMHLNRVQSKTKRCKPVNRFYSPRSM